MALKIKMKLFSFFLFLQWEVVNSQWLTTQLFLYKHDHYYDMIDDENTCDFYNAYLYLLKYVILVCMLHKDMSFCKTPHANFFCK